MATLAQQHPSQLLSEIANGDGFACTQELQAIAALAHTASLPAASMRFAAARLGASVAACGLGGAQETHATRKLWLGRALRALQLLIMRPFCRLAEIAHACGCEIAEAAMLVSAIHRDAEIKAFLNTSSGDAPYRRNTVQPIIDSGAVDAYLKNTFRYPFTVGIYPAVSCMLSCNFCGRARGSQYKQEDIQPGNALLRQLFAEAPRNDPHRFYLSGGLEPLTNPGLGELVRFAASLGHRLQLYTNAMMLTPHFLERNQGLWDLETIRISLYGGDDATAQLTTLRSGVATRVIANAKDFVRLKAERHSRLRLGFNHVIQSGQVGHLRKIAQALIDVAGQSPDRKGVDFLTLRENYAASGEAAISGAERSLLRDELLALREFFHAEGMGHLTVDLGYAMQGLVEGFETEPVRRVTPAEVLPRGYPQISVVVDLLGDVYLYREAAFIGRAGADRYIIGRLRPGFGLEDILRGFIASRESRIVPQSGDELFLDAFDHAVTAFLHQAHDDVRFGATLSGLSLPGWTPRIAHCGALGELA